MTPMLPSRTFTLALFLALAALNLGLELAAAPGAGFFLRGAPVWVLAVRLVQRVPIRKSRWVVTALLLGSLGDIVLAAASTDYQVPLFLTGMGLFLLGHLFYIATFVPEAQPRPARLAIAGLFVALGLTVSTLLVHALGGKAIPLLIYAGALLGMGSAAALRRSNRWTVLAGAALFILSDALIAVNRFLQPFPLAILAILCTYWGAQFLIAEGWAADHVRATGQDSAGSSEEASAA